MWRISPWRFLNIIYIHITAQINRNHITRHDFSMDDTLREHRPPCLCVCRNITELDQTLQMIKLTEPRWRRTERVRSKMAVVVGWRSVCAVMETRQRGVFLMTAQLCVRMMWSGRIHYLLRNSAVPGTHGDSTLHSLHGSGSVHFNSLYTFQLLLRLTKFGIGCLCLYIAREMHISH